MKKLPPMPFVIFSFAFIVVGVLSTLSLPCPIDGGTGILKAAQGLQVGSIDTKLISEKDVVVPGQVCDALLKQTQFNYAVNMSITNNSTETSQGLVSVIFNRADSATPVQMDAEGVPQTYQAPTVPAYVDVPAGTTKNFKFVFTFLDNPLAPQEPPHQVTVTAGQDMPDPTCHGTGKLSFVHWLQAKLNGTAALQ